jgi:PPM family protein phosphatase
MQEPMVEAGLVVTAAGGTDVGRTRDHNEDTVLLRPDLHLYVLADGAGGHNAGEVASALAATAVGSYFEATQKQSRSKPDVDEFGLWTGARRLAASVHKANRDVYEISRASKKHSGMGTTIVAAALSPRSGVLHVAYVGDSRCYRLRHGYLEQLTEDHSLLGDLLELRPDIDRETLARLPNNVITRALGMDKTVRVPTRTFELAPGDRYLLCSDGLSNRVSHPALAQILGRPEPPEALVRSLIDAANEAGGDDNIAAVAILCEPAKPAASDRPMGFAGARRASEPAPPLLNRDDSVPEIMLIGIEEVDLGPAAAIRMVPAQEPDPELLDTLGQLMMGSTRSRPPSAESRDCKSCGESIDTPFCPFCGARAQD